MGDDMGILLELFGIVLMLAYVNISLWRIAEALERKNYDGE